MIQVIEMFNMIYLKWFGSFLILALGFVLAPIIFPIAYLLRDIEIVRQKLLWAFYDDEDEFGYDVDWWMGDKEENFWTAYKWAALRNPAWNLHTLFSLKKITAVFTKVKGGLTKGGKDVEVALGNSAVLKYEDADGNYMNNKGEYLSIKYSMLGSLYAEFYDYTSESKYWRYSFAGKVYKSMWLELQIGYTTRATFRLKVKNIKKIK